MSSILSEIKNTLETSSIKDAVVNMYHDTINKLSKVKDVFVKKEEPEILPTIVKDAKPVKDEGYASPAKPKTPGEIIKATLTNIKNVVWDYLFKFIVSFFYIMLASLVANDMIIYAAPIRAFFFLFTLFFTTTIFPCAIVVAIYYLLKKGYDYYNQYLSSAKDKPLKCFPMIFAILPLTTYYPTSPFIRFFLWIFMYQKSDKPERMEKENERLEDIMKKYWDDLNGSFEYLDKIKDTPPFKNFYEIVEKKLTIEGMHPIQKPEKVVELSKTLPDVIGKENKTGDAKTSSLPATIASPKNTSSLPATIASPNNTSALPATNASPKNTSALPATNASQEKTAPLPATIASPTNSSPNSTKAEPAKAEPAKAEPAAPVPPTI